MNTASSWGNSTGFGSTNAQAGSSTQANNSLFGTTNQASQTSGLFGNSSSSSGATGGLFGNSTSNATSTGPAGGLFGNSSGAKPATGLFGSTGAPSTNPPNSNSASNGGLFGNSSTAGSTGGLFGNSSKRAMSEGPTAPSGGLFSNTTPASGGLFGSSATQQAPSSGGLFGSSNSQAPSGGLFGSSNTGSNAAANTTSASNSSGLFGNTNKTQSAGLFGASDATPSSGLFGNSNTSGSGNSIQTNASGSLFGNSASTNAPNLNLNPSSSNAYGSNSILSAINASERAMPMSITRSLFGVSPNSNIKKDQATTPSSKDFKNSLLGRLAQTFKIFRPSNNQNAAKINLKGVFTQSNYVKDVPSPDAAKFKIHKPNRGVNISSRSLGTVNKLIIKSKPTKFHLIDADKVFKAKTCNVVASTRDDDLSETESLEELPVPEPSAAKFPKSAKTMEGHGIETYDALLDDKTDDPESNNGYFCYPSIKELTSSTPSQLQQVPDFIIGRIGHGQINYDFPVDLSVVFETFAFDTKAIANELFGRLFIFEAPRITVYDKERYKTPPPPKTELNVPATLTIKVTPKKWETIEELIRRLRNVEDSEFVTFDPITSNWIFKVQHFSVWGLLDDDEMEGDEAEELKRLREKKKKQDERDRSYSKQSSLYENELYRSELKRQKVQRQTSGLPGGWEFDTTVKADSSILKVKQGLVQNEINQEVSQFKTDKSAIYIATNASDITSDSDGHSFEDNQNGLALDGPLFPDEVRNYDYIKEIVHAAPTNFELDNIVDEKVFEPDLDDQDALNVYEKTSSFPVSKSWLLQLELANEVGSALSPDLACYRKTQPALNSVNDILFAGLPNANQSYQASTPKRETPQSCLLLDTESSHDKDILKKFTNNVLIKSTVECRSNSYPLLVIDHELTFKTVSALLSDSTDAKYLRLAAILFDKPDLSSFSKYSDLDYSNTHLVKRLENIEERQAFAKWLKAYNKQTYENFFISQDPLDKIYSSVCQGELKEATALAVESCNMHLAPLLALMDSNDTTVRTIAKSQLLSWKESGSEEFIPEPLVKLYRLLAGEFSSFVDELPDYVYLGLEIFYGNPAESISSLITRLPENFKLDDDLGSVLMINTAYKTGSFAECCKLLVDSSLNAKLKWIIYQILSGNSLSKKDVSAQDAIGSSFGKNLENYGLWREALYVYASMGNDDEVKKVIRASVINSVKNFEEDKEQQEYLEKVLRLPKELIFEAIAIRKRSKEDYWGCGDALVVAGLWEEAHELICERLAPLAVIEEGTYMKSVVRALIESFPQEGKLIGSWNQGAGLYSKYFQVTEQADNEEEVEVSDIAYLLDNLALLEKKTHYLVNVASQIMSKRTGDLALECQGKLGQATDKIFNLSLGENERTYFAARLGK